MRNHPIQRNHVIVATLTRNVRNDLTGEIEVHEFQVEVDASALIAHLGRKAIVSKVRKSKSSFGAIVVTDMRKVS